MGYSKNPAESQGRRLPKTVTQRTNNATRLVALRRRCTDVETILGQLPPTCRDQADIRREVTCLAAEISILAEPTNPEAAFWAESAGFLARLFGADSVLALWDAHAAGPIRIHMEWMQAAPAALARDHEARIRNVRLVSDRSLSAALGFTFALRREIFDGKCALVPVAERTEADRVVSLTLRETADRHGLSRDRLRRAYKAGGMAAVETLIAEHVAKPAPSYEKRPKRGRPVVGKVRVADRVAKLATETGRSERTVWSMYSLFKAHETDLSEEALWRAVRRGLLVCGSKYRHGSRDADMIVAHHEKAFGRAPSKSQISNWRKDGTYSTRVSDAARFFALAEIRSLDRASSGRIEDEIHPFAEPADADAVRPFRATDPDADTRPETADADPQARADGR